MIPNGAQSLVPAPKVGGGGSGASVQSLASRVLAFGHSYLTGGGASDADSQYITLLSGMLRCDLIDLGVGGSQLANDQSWLGAAGGAGGWAWLLQNVAPTKAAPYTPENVLPLLHWGQNDLQYHAHDGTGAPRTIFKTALRTAMSRLVSARVFEDNHASVVLGGVTWQGAVVDTNRNSGTQYRPIPGNGATFTITLPADFEGGTIAIGLTVWPLSDGQITWTGTASQLPATTTLAGLAYAAGGTLLRRDSSNGHVVRITGLVASDAGKTIIGTYGSGAGTAFSTPAQPGALTVNGTAGAVTYGYKRVYRTYNGDTIPSTERTVATGNATLTATNSITIPTGGAWPSGVVQELILRTTGGATQGIVGILSAPGAFTDTGVTAVTPSPPGGFGIAAIAYTANTTNPLTGGAAFDYWQIEANTPIARGVVMKVNRIPDAGYLNSAVDADITNYNADIDTIVAEFAASQWLAVDLDTTLAKSAALFASDNIHPNNRGHATIAGAFWSQFAAWAAGFAPKDVALQSRVARRVTSRRLSIQKYAADGSLGLGAVPANGTIAAASLPFAGAGTADYQLDNSFRVIDTVNLMQALDADVGDDIEVELSAVVSNAAAALFLDCAFVDGSNNVLRYFSANPNAPLTVTAFGWPAWYNSNEAIVRHVSGKAYATVTASDVVTVNVIPGQVRIGLIGFSNGRILYGGGSSGSPPISFSVKNVGRRNVGFNTS